MITRYEFTLADLEPMSEAVRVLTSLRREVSYGPMAAWRKLNNAQEYLTTLMDSIPIVLETFKEEQ